MAETLQRLDPPGCACTDCLTGYSKTIDTATQDELRELLAGKLYNGCSDDWPVIRIKFERTIPGKAVGSPTYEVRY